MSDEKAPQLADFPSQTFDKLRYSDTDRQGHINNSVFAKLLETGRVEVLYSETQPLTEPGANFVIARLELDFKAELKWPGQADIGTRVLSVGRSSVRLEQAVFQEGRLAAVAQTVIVQMNEQTRRSHPLSERAAARLRELS